MSDVKAVDDFKASKILAAVGTTFKNLSDAERTAQIKKTNGIFELHITNAQKKVGVWTIDLKDKGAVYDGSVRAPAKAGVALFMSDDTFDKLASGELDGQKAFMVGKLKTKGNVMLATKLAAVLEMTGPKAKL